MIAPETMPYLLSRLRRQPDGDAWTQLVELYQPLIYGYCRQRGLQDADSADVVQDVFAAVARAMPTFHYDRGRGLFRSWLLRVTKSKLANLINQRGPETQPVDGQLIQRMAVSYDSNRLERAEQAQRRQGLFDSVAEEVRAEFRETTWKAFWLTTMQGFSSREVSKHLGISVQAVYIAKSRVIKRFKQKTQALVASRG